MSTVFWSGPFEINKSATPTKLRRIQIDEVSLVDKGANQHSFVTLIKRDENVVAQKEFSQMNAEGFTALAKRIVAGEIANTQPKHDWLRVINKLAEDQRASGETSEQSFVRYINGDGRALYNAMKSASGPDHVPPEPEAAPVIKADSAYGKLQTIAKELQATDPKLTDAGAFAKAFIDPKNRSLADQAKVENAFI